MTEPQFQQLYAVLKTMNTQLADMREVLDRLARCLGETYTGVPVIHTENVEE